MSILTNADNADRQNIHARAREGGANDVCIVSGEVSSEVLAFAVRLRGRFGDGVKLYPWPGYLDRLDRLGLDTKALRAERWGIR